MNFDDDCLNFDFNNNDNKEMVHNVHVSMIDQLLCDLNFGREPLTTKDESKGKMVNNIQENKMTQNAQTTPKSSEQETLKKIPVENNDEMKAQNISTDILTYQVSPISSSSDPSYVEPANETNPTTTTRTTMNGAQTTVNGTQPTVAPHTYVTNKTQMAGSSRIKLVNGTQPSVAPRTHIMNETQTGVIFPTMEITRQKHKPTRRKIYSFVELLIYQFSPITKELYNDVNGRFSHYVMDYDLLKDNPQMVNNQPRRPGVLRGTIYQHRNGWNGQSLDARDRSIDYKNEKVVTSPIGKHFESPLELSFLKECVIAQNRWTALMYERGLRTSCVKEIKDCKSVKWINAHMNITDKHSESCLALHVVNDQKNKIYRGKNVRFEEKDEHHDF
jgi:hypothetical protein